MQFTVLDSLSLPGNPSKPNEDAFAQSGRAALVMDGATGLGEQLMPGRSDAAWIASFGARRVMAYLADGASGAEAVTAALFDAQTSFEALRKRPPRETFEVPFASLMLVVADDDGFEALSYGDCAALVQRPGGEVEVLGDAFGKRAQEAAGAARLARAKGLNPAGGANLPEFLDALRRVRNRRNTDAGSWSFGPDMRAADHVARVAMRAPSGSKILLATDGFLALACDYGAYDAAGLIAAAQEKGLKALGQELRGIESGDPEGVSYPRFKTSDDATAVLLALS